jgi:SAM-dependent methyltransferase
MRKKKRARLARWLVGDGIEIGALYRALAVPRTARVRYVDRLSVPDLRKHYEELADLELTPVDLIGSAENLSVLEDESIDFIVANHVFEHLEYPIRALCEFMRVLRPRGVVYMALPDQRCGIDIDRCVTSFEHLIGEHRMGAEANRPDHYRDWVVNAEKHRPEDQEERIARLLDMDYAIHFHVWNADTFLDFLAGVRRETPLQFEVVAFAPPEYMGDDELIVILSKGHSVHPRRSPDPESLRQRVARSALGPVLRPPYRLAKSTAAKLRR